jgi:hypothetical protein
MSQASKRKRRGKALPALGIAGVAGVSLSLTGGASASTGGAATDVQQNVSPNHQLFLGEEEISDVSLSTFYVFDKESAKPQLGDKVAWWRGCGGCRGCRCGGCGCGWRGCGGCGGCGCCWSWGRCRAC